jgi:hypothetical protein
MNKSAFRLRLKGEICVSHPSQRTRRMGHPSIAPISCTQLWTGPRVRLSFKERRMKSRELTRLHRKSGLVEGIEPNALLQPLSCYREVACSQASAGATASHPWSKGHEESPNLGRLFIGRRWHYKTMTRKQSKQALNQSCEPTPGTCCNRKSERARRSDAEIEP